ncbi:hypothetical protein [Clostridium sp. KNHs205]|jgi:hypothetical protein|uniref:hypothetical protein n=1 Tax=Clostridium sp. KNHs205 TaxID=1449050 RepID=UPI000A8353CD|nr:hypothetical protein [Clostridium sp. KNHs205]
MGNNDCWDKFARSGNIYDYLSYIACTVERDMDKMSGDKKEGGSPDDNFGCDRDGTFSHARG